jgi:hypothetical protein
MRHVSLKRPRLAVLAVIVLAAGVVACGGDTADEAGSTTAAPTTVTETTAGADPTSPDTMAPDTTRPVISGEAPRSDTPIFPGAELVKENTYPVAVEEIYATNAALDDVLAFYAAVPGFDAIADGTAYADGPGGYIETEVFRLVRQGASEAEIIAEVGVSGPLMILAVLPSDASLLGSMFLSGELAGQLPQGSTVIVMRILTG